MKSCGSPFLVLKIGQVGTGLLGMVDTRKWITKI
nr:MAG TPA: hypothetical protein [Caudoviricetes sp.]